MLRTELREAGKARGAAAGRGILGRVAIFGSAALVVGLLASSGAQAQCTSTLPAFTFGGLTFTNQSFLPLAQGGSVNSLVSVLNTVNTAFLTNTTAFVSAPGGPRPDQQGGGAWARGIGGTVETENTGVTTVNTSSLGFTTPGQTNCNTTTRTDFSGFQVGHDISILNGGGTGANWHVGATAGYFEADAKDKSPGGTFSGNFQVPFAGVYTAFTNGGFFLDGQVRFDFYQNTLTDSANGLFGQDFNAYGVALTSNVGYNQPLGGGWFIEPSLGVVWSRVSVDPLNVSGTLILANNPGIALPGTAEIEDIESLLGRASLRFGTNFTTGGLALQPFMTASVFREFAGDVHTTMTANGALLGIPSFTASLTTDRVGTYGQIGLGSAAAIINTGWLGYARVDYKFGENIEGWNVNAGLRYQFNPDPAPVAGMKDGPAPEPVYAYNWTGFYAGGSAGALWGRENWTFTNAAGAPTGAPNVDSDYAGYLLGGQVGYNLQLGRVVVGVEGDYGTSNAHGGVSCPNLFLFTCGAEVDRLGSVAGRVGYTWGRALFYGKAGWAFAEVAPKGHQNTGGNPLLPGLAPLVTPINNSKRLDGVTYGAGMEFALTNYMSAKAEWMRYDLGSEIYQVSNGPEYADISARGSTVRIGVNFHLNPVRREEAPLK